MWFKQIRDTESGTEEQETACCKWLARRRKEGIKIRQGCGEEGWDGSSEKDDMQMEEVVEREWTKEIQDVKWLHVRRKWYAGLVKVLAVRRQWEKNEERYRRLKTKKVAKLIREVKKKCRTEVKEACAKGMIGEKSLYYEFMMERIDAVVHEATCWAMRRQRRDKRIERRKASIAVENNDMRVLLYEAVCNRAEKREAGMAQR